MGLSKTIWANPTEFLVREQPDQPVAFFAPMVLQATAKAWIEGFAGQTAYDLRANPDATVIANLAAAGMGAFGVAGLDHARQVARVAPGAALRCVLPLAAPDDVAQAVALGVGGFTVASLDDLRLLAPVPAGAEVAVDLSLPGAADLLCAVRDAGFAVALALVTAGDVARQIRAAADLARAADVRLARLIVVGGGESRDVLDAALQTAMPAFGATRPALTCLLGYELSEGAFNLAARADTVSPDLDTMPPADLRAADFVILRGAGFAPPQARSAGLGSIRIATVMRLHV